MKLPLLGLTIDERFFTFRLRSTSIAGVTTGALSVVLFAWRFYINHVWSWDLLAVALTFVGVKMSLMAWYYLTH